MKNNQMTFSTTEYLTIQKPLVEFFQKMGYIYISPQEMQKMRTSTKEVILKDILHSHLCKATFTHKGQNHSFSSEGIARAIRELESPSSEGLLKSNENMTLKLLYGIEIPQPLQDGSSKNFTLPLIDFANPQANHFSFTEEFEVLREQDGEKHKHRRPDIVLFVNGIPLVVIELKKSGVDIGEGISQMVRNQKNGEIPYFFRFVQLTLAGNNQDAKYGTVGTQKKHYARWVEEDEEYMPPFFGEANAHATQKLVYSLLSKERLLEIISSFVVFEKSSKKVARHQQYFAIKNTLKRVQSHSDGARAGGLIWHTQGSGKSLTMSLLATQLKHSIPQSKIIVVTDRKDLDTQIHKVFGNVGVRVSQAKNSAHLGRLLASGVSVITTLVHKFKELKAKVEDSRDIFVLVDEAHRTQGGELHLCMKEVFPSGCYIGFTGTPLLSREKGSLQKFGGFIHKYTIEQAIRDEAVLPLCYEGRMSEQFVNNEEGLNKRFEILSRDLSDKEKSDLKAKFAQFRKIAPNLERLEWIAWDISRHYKSSVHPLKAMLATSSKYEAIKYHQIFKSSGLLRSAFVISAPDMREGYEDVENDNQDAVRRAWEELMREYSSEEAYMQHIQDEFVNGEEIELLIVVDKLLTGFDAPNVGCLYIDKPLKEHNLLQAIARANRLMEGKEYGLIIDYRGLLGDLSKALSDYQVLSGYDEQDISQAVISLQKQSLEVREKYQALRRFFDGLESQEDYEVSLADENRRKEFYSLLLEFSKSLKLLFSGENYQKDFTSEEIDIFKEALKFYTQLKRSVELRYHEKIDFKSYEKQMQELIDRYIGANEVEVLVELVGIFDERFLTQGEQMPTNARADRILSATSQVITQEREKNPFFYDELSKRINQVLEEYKQGRIDEITKLIKAKQIYQELKEYSNNSDQSYPKALGKIAQKAFYDNLKSRFEDEEKLVEFVLKLDEVFMQKSQKPDWERNSEVSKQIEQAIDDLLYDYGVQVDSNEVEKLIVQVREIGQKNYARSQDNL